MPQSKLANRPPLAVVGVSALFPGSMDASGFWSDILAGSDLISDVPDSHWLVEDFYDPDPSAPDKTYAKRGAFLGDIDFDALGWGVPPSILPATDTAQLLALIVAERVLHDASRGQPETLDRSRISVILGVTSAQELLSSLVSRLQRPVWVKTLRESGLPESEVQVICDRIADHYVPWQESSFPGLLGNVVAGRIANRLDLGGTNCVTDAACASTFSALHMAAYELYLGDSDMVVVGGVDAMNDIFMFMCFSKTPALSASGDCRPFSDQADGTMLGEGLGMVALKRLDDAERDGDRIYAVIRGVGSSSDGRSKSVYAPVSAGQANAIRRAYDHAGFDAGTVELVEAHGTGTRAGDLAEFGGLRAVFEESGRTDRQWCALGTVKSQIGHAKAAAGAAGLFKAVMALHHKVLPPTIKVERPNPKLEIDGSPLYLNTRTRPWIRGSGHPRRAGVSSFGFGGSNFHVALEEYTGDGEAAPRLRPTGSELVLVTGNSGAEVARRARELALQAQVEGALRWLSWSTQEDWNHEAPARLAVVASDEAELRRRLETAASAIEAAPREALSRPDGIHYGTGVLEGSLAMLFPGQGSQYVGMGADLAMHLTPAREVWDRVADLGLHDVVFPRPVFDEAAEAEQTRHLTATEWAQPAIVATSLSLLSVLRTMGVVPDMVGGHSLGEVTALCAAGVLGEHDVIGVARRRGELMSEAAAVPGAMTVVSRGLEEVQGLLSEIGLPVALANHNGPRQVVLSGRTEDIDELDGALAQRGIRSRRLPVATAFHSEIVAPAAVPLREHLAGVELGGAQIPVFSNATTLPYESGDDAVRDRLSAQLAQPVRFVEMVENMLAAGARTFIEVGPGTVLGGLAERILEGRGCTIVSLDPKGKDGLTALTQGIARLAAAGLAMDLGALWQEYACPEDPSQRKQPKLAVQINGSNYGKVYPPAGGATALPAPNPEKPEAPVAPVSQQPRAPTFPRAARPPVAKPPVATPPVATPPVATPPVATPPVATPPVATPSAGLPAGWIQAFEQAQIKTAEVQNMFQQTMVNAQTAYLEAAQASFMVLGSLAGGADLGVPTAPRPGLPVPAVPVAVPVPVLPVAAPVPPVVAPVPPAPPAVSSAAPALSAASAVDLQQLMLEVVADKTGYPAEMLELGMELEGELGIDSIKRVEILSAVQERAPSLPEVDAAQMASLQTLGEIVTYMQSLLGAPAPSAAPALDLQQLMLEVVADKTGYPAEMLELGMELEGELGIDSIKRVEILSAVQERAPSLPEVDAAQMASLQTLGEIVTYMQSLLGGPVTEPVQPAQVQLVKAGLVEQPTLGRYVLELTSAPPRGLALPGLWDEGPLFVTDDSTGIAHAVTAELGRRGVEAQVVGRVPDGAHKVLFLGGLRKVDHDDAAIAVNREAFAAARTIAGTLAERGGLFVTVQDTGGCFGLRGFDPRRAWLAGAPALVKTAAQEWPGASLKAIDIEVGGRSADELAAALVDELVLGGAELEVGLTADGSRLSLRSARAEVVRGPRVIGRDDVVVVSGGARGVTAASVVAWAHECNARFVLLGRTALSDEPPCCRDLSTDAELKHALLAEAREAGTIPKPAELGRQVRAVLSNREIRSTVTAIEAAGAAARYVAVDVTDTDGLGRALADVRKAWGPVSAVVHGAGVIADKRIAEKTEAQFDRVFDTKVEGLRALLAVTAADPLKLLCLFSSVSARCGNNGQSDYAMANEVLNKVAQAEAARRPDMLVKSLGWGPWEGGMVGPELEAHFASLGVPMIPLDVGGRILADELHGADPGRVELVLGGEPSVEALLMAGNEHRGLRMELRLDSTSHGFLSGHAIAGTAVVPVVLVVNWMSRLAESFRPDLELAAIEQLKVLKGIRLDGFDGAGDRVVLTCRQVHNGDGARLALEVSSTSGVPHYRAQAHMVERREPLQGGLPEVALDAWGDGPVYDGDTLFHGAGFRVIERMSGMSRAGAAATLRGQKATEDSPEEKDVAVYDGGLQLALLWARHVLGGASLPTRIDEVRGGALRTLPPGEIQCVVVGRESTRSRAVSDVVFVDGQGERLVELRGVETHLRPDVPDIRAK